MKLWAEQNGCPEITNSVADDDIIMWDRDTPIWDARTAFDDDAA